MRTKLIILTGITALLAIACSKESEVKERYSVFYTSFDGSAETRTYIDESFKIHWNADDLVSIFQTTSNGKFAFTGKDGDRSGAFEELSVPGEGTEISSIYAVYPYSSSTTISDTEVLSVELPSTQAYAEGSFGPGANTMVCRTQDDKLFFKNLCGFMVIKLYGSGVKVKSVSFKANNGEPIAGKANVTFDSEGNPVSSIAQGTDEITVVSENAVTLGSSASDYTEFWFVVPPATLSGGFTITVNGANGGKFEKVSTKERAITRNDITPMTPLEVVLSGGNQIGDGEEQDGGNY